MTPSPRNWKEARRLQAWRLTQRGWSQPQITEALAAVRARSLWLPGRALDPRTHGRRDSRSVWSLLASRPRQPFVPNEALEPPKARAACPAARRSRHHPVARRHMARDHKGAQAQQHTILCGDESGCYPLPSAVRTYAPVGQTPILREWWTRDYLSAISAVSPEGKLSCRCQDHAIHSNDVIAWLCRKFCSGGHEGAVASV